MTPLVVGFLLDFIMVIGKVLTEQGVLNPKIELEHENALPRPSSGLFHPYLKFLD